MWKRNANLLGKGKATALQERYGYRVIYIPGFACPASQEEGGCGAEGDSPRECASCGVLANNFKRIYQPATTIEHSHALWRNPTNPNYPEQLEHRWLVSAPIIADQAGRVYTYLADFKLDGRQIIWLSEGVADRQKYTVSYTAYLEDAVQIIHAQADGTIPRLAEQGVVMAPAYIEQGYVGLSVGPEASCFEMDAGDLIVVADQTVKHTQIIDLTLPRRKAYNRWINKVNKGFYRVRLPNGDFSMVDCTDKIGYSFTTGEWDFSQIPEGITNLSIQFSAAPMYTVNTDAGEARSPAHGAQPRLYKMVRIETTY